MARKTKVEFTADEQAELEQMKRHGAAQKLFDTFHRALGAALTTPAWLILRDLYEAPEGQPEGFLTGKYVVAGVEADYEDALRELVRVRVLTKNGDRYTWTNTHEGAALKVIYDAAMGGKPFKDALDLLNKYRHGVEEPEEQGKS